MRLNLSKPTPVSGLNPWLTRFAFLCAGATLALIGIGGLVTSRGVGMAVPDWPTTYGYNMFLFPVSKWVGGVFYEHTHRLVASIVGVLVVALARWLGGRQARWPLAIIGLAEVLAGIGLVQFSAELRGTGHFLSGIGGVVLLAAAVWVRNEPAPKPLPLLGWIAFALVQLQGLLGGLRVVLFKDEIGIFHGTLAHLFFVLLCVITLLATRWWAVQQPRVNGPGRVRALCLGGAVLILLQLILGATMRHQHAGLAIPDFPLAHGKVWPVTDPLAVEIYNQRRVEVTSVKPITSSQIVLQMVHRLVAVLILAAVGAAAWASRKAKNAITGLTQLWLALILIQVLLGAATIWSNKAADMATAHVLVGSVSLALGTILCLISYRELAFALRPTVAPRSDKFFPDTAFGPRPATASGTESL